MVGAERGATVNEPRNLIRAVDANSHKASLIERQAQTTTSSLQFVHSRNQTRNTPARNRHIAVLYQVPSYLRDFGLDPGSPCGRGTRNPFDACSMHSVSICNPTGLFYTNGYGSPVWTTACPILHARPLQNACEG